MQNSEMLGQGIVSITIWRQEACTNVPQENLFLFIGNWSNRVIIWQVINRTPKSKGMADVVVFSCVVGTEHS